MGRWGGDFGANTLLKFWSSRVSNTVTSTLCMCVVTGDYYLIIINESNPHGSQIE